MTSTTVRLGLMALALAILAIIPSSRVAARAGGTRPCFLTANATSVAQTGSVTLTSRLTETNGTTGLAGRRVKFYVQTASYSASIGTAFTTNNGTVTLAFRPKDYNIPKGNHRLAVEFTGDGAYCGSLPSAPLTVK